MEIKRNKTVDKVINNIKPIISKIAPPPKKKKKNHWLNDLRVKIILGYENHNK